ncbi:testis-expressed protein 9-like [Euwallacea fornicatus]|uniref:testis-expressed protein 9-like n=1 Tax=Euwallacea fornicatus TaxID=995702 RepID=UPI003390194A
MESNLLLKENEFRKENEQLELKTQQIMCKVKDVMKIQDNLIKDSFKTLAELREARKLKPLLTTSEDIEEFLNKDSAQEERSLGVVKVYKAKIRSLIAEKERGQIELRQKSEEMRKQEKEIQTLKEEKEKWFLMYTSGKNATGKLERELTNLNSKLQFKDAEISSLKKETDHLKKDLKTTSASLNNAEVRLARATEETDKIKTSLKQCKEEEKELQESYRKQLTGLTAAVKKLEKQKIELLNGFKKQMQLVDALKQQKVQLEALKIAEMLEGEYLKILEWKFD